MPNELSSICAVVIAFSACSFAQLELPLPKVELKQDTRTAFESCLTEMEASITKKRSSIQTFVRNYDRTQADDQGVVINEAVPCSKPVPHGLVHHWIADTLISGATVQDVLKELKDVENFPIVYSPRVVNTEPVSQSGDTRRVKIRFTSTVLLDTVVLDVVFDIQGGQLDESHIYNTSRSVHVQQIKNAGKPSEKPLPEGKDEGTLWRQNTYWRLEQGANGVVAECETISLSTDLNILEKPTIGPLLKTLPKESLKFTLTQTRNAVLSLPKTQ